MLGLYVPIVLPILAREHAASAASRRAHAVARAGAIVVIGSPQVAAWTARGMMMTCTSSSQTSTQPLLVLAPGLVGDQVWNHVDDGHSNGVASCSLKFTSLR